MEAVLFLLCVLTKNAQYYYIQDYPYDPDRFSLTAERTAVNERLVAYFVKGHIQNFIQHALVIKYFIKRYI